MRIAIIGATLALAVTAVVAQTNIVEDDINGGALILPGCKAALIAQIDQSLANQADGSLLAGMCVGYIRAIHTFTATPRRVRRVWMSRSYIWPPTRCSTRGRARSDRFESWGCRSWGLPG
jgi:hypothetical protein